MYRTSNPMKKVAVTKRCLEAVQSLLTVHSVSDIRKALDVLNPPMEVLEGPYGRVLH